METIKGNRRSYAGLRIHESVEAEWSGPVLVIVFIADSIKRSPEFSVVCPVPWIQDSPSIRGAESAKSTLVYCEVLFLLGSFLN